MFVTQPFCYRSGVSDLPIGNQLRECLRKWVTPPDPSTNQNIACDLHHGGTAEWFSQGSIFTEWKSAGSLLWIYGKRTFFLLFPDRPLITVYNLSWFRKEHPLVRHRSTSTRTTSSSLYPLVLRSSKTSNAYAKQGQH
jgi:hypothetical protein